MDIFIKKDKIINIGILSNNFIVRVNKIHYIDYDLNIQIRKDLSSELTVKHIRDNVI